MWPGVFGWCHAPEAWAEIWEKDLSWVLASEEDGWLSGLAEALRRVPHVVWGRWKSQHRTIVYLSPYVEKPLNSKRWTKVSYLNQFRKFRVTGFLYSIYISMNIMNVLCTGMNMIISRCSIIAMLHFPFLRTYIICSFYFPVIHLQSKLSVGFRRYVITCREVRSPKSYVHEMTLNYFW